MCIGFLACFATFSHQSKSFEKSSSKTYLTDPWTFIYTKLDRSLIEPLIIQNCSQGVGLRGDLRPKPRGPGRSAKLGNCSEISRGPENEAAQLFSLPMQATVLLLKNLKPHFMPRRLFWEGLSTG